MKKFSYNQSLSLSLSPSLSLFRSISVTSRQHNRDKSKESFIIHLASVRQLQKIFKIAKVKANNKRLTHKYKRFSEFPLHFLSTFYFFYYYYYYYHCFPFFLSGQKLKSHLTFNWYSLTPQKRPNEFDVKTFASKTLMCKQLSCAFFPSAIIRKVRQLWPAPPINQ